MDMYYILDSNNTLIDRNKSYMEMKVLSDILNSNSYYDLVLDCKVREQIRLKK